MTTCPHCGQEILASSQACSHCGQELSKATPRYDQFKDPLANPDYEFQPMEYMRQGWRLFWEYPGGFVLFLVLTIAIQAALNFLPQFLSILASLVSCILTMGFIMVALKLLRKDPPSFGDFFSAFKYTVPLLLMYLVVAAFIVIGAIPVVGVLSIIGALKANIIMVLVVIFIMITIFCLVSIYFYAPFLIVHRQMGFWAAMELSRQAAKRHWTRIINLIVLMTLINIAGILLLLVGLLVTVPWTYCAMTVAYADVFGLKTQA
jgi:NhaP-type Na+/H+ or K+/H+ antiporter